MYLYPNVSTVNRLINLLISHKKPPTRLSKSGYFNLDIYFVFICPLHENIILTMG